MYDSPDDAQGLAKGTAIRQVSYRKQIEANLNHLRQQVTKQEEMLKLLDENPAIEKFMDLSRS
jgi:hypothetical protein